MGLGHDIISGISSLVGKGLTYNLWTRLHDYSTYLRSTGIIVWLGLIIISMSAVKGLKVTCINESGSVLLIR